MILGLGSDTGGGGEGNEGGGGGDEQTKSEAKASYFEE